jgi:hypothetical protein
MGEELKALPAIEWDSDSAGKHQVSVSPARAESATLPKALESLSALSDQCFEIGRSATPLKHQQVQ